MPRTEAGKRLLADWGPRQIIDGHGGDDLRDAIAAIEAEAVARDRARILAAIERGPDMGDHEFNWKSYLRTIVEMP